MFPATRALVCLLLLQCCSWATMSAANENGVASASNWKSVLSEKELDWIQKHPDIRLGIDPEFFPFEFREENGEYQGIASDYVKMFRERFGLNMRVMDRITWPDAVAGIQHGKIDVLPCIGVTKERSAFVLFSKPYIRYQRVILSRTNMPFVSSLEDLKSLRVGLQASSSLEGLVRENSSIQPITFASLEECLLALSDGKIDAAVANLASSAYWIRRLNLTNLKVAAPASNELGTLHFAVSKDLPELVSIVDKGLSLVTPDEQRAIERRWVGVEYKPGIDPRMAWRIGLRIAMAIVLIIAAILILMYRAQSRIRKKFITEVQERERQISLIYDTVGDVIFNIKMDKDGNFYFASVNKKFVDVTGIQAGNVIGQQVRNIIPEPSLSLALGKYAEAIRAKKIMRWEEVSEYPTGRLIGEVSIAPVFDNSQNCVSLVGSVHDITERKHAEDEIRKLNTELERRVAERTAELVVAKDRAESADRLKSAFLATMSHELRTPLNSIIGFTGIILQGLVGELTEEQRKQLNMVRDSAHHLLSLINDVLDISKIEAGQLELQREDFILQQAIDKSVQVVRPMADKKSLPISLTIESSPLAMYSDRRRVEQVLINLLSNAVKFTDRGGITLAVRKSQDSHASDDLSEKKAGENSILRISIIDTGIGIKAEDIKELFKPFRQIDTGTTRRYEGTGLGLSICKRLACMLGGDIEVQSDGPGMGSTFTFTLPLQGERNG
jgi:PAS domain S-box-containing protein